MQRARVVILGAGVAGAAAAYGLARRGIHDVCILERDTFPGRRASGRNASLIRRNLKTDTDCRLAIEAADWFRRPPKDFPAEIAWRTTGSLLTYRAPELPQVERDMERQRRAGLSFERIAPREAVRLQPLLSPEAFDEAQWTPDDGCIDIVELLKGFLTFAIERGAQLRCGTAAERLLVEGGRCVGVQTEAGPIRAEWVMNAAGAWANGLVSDAADRLPMTPCRRTMLVTEDVQADSTKPFTWDDGLGFYFRPDHGALLWSPCDEVPSDLCEESVDPAWVERARARARRLIPSAASLRLAYQWGCLRTLTTDREMFIGPDPTLPGLFWVAGLGGHGVTNSPRIAELVGDLFLEGTSGVLDPVIVAPRRSAAP